MEGIRPIGYNAGVSAVRSRSRYASRAYVSAVAPAQPEAPVEPVSRVRPVKREAAARITFSSRETRVPTEDDLNNAADHLARMRIQYPDREQDSAAQALAQLGAGVY